MTTRFLLRFALLLPLILNPPLLAATYTVTTTNDTGPNSLRAVITTANGVAGPHTIGFGSSGHFAGGGTIALVSPLPEITQSVTIAGWRNPGATTNAIAVTGSPVVFGPGTSNSVQQLNVTGSVTNGQSLSITECVISNGGIQSTGVLQIISSSVVASPTAGIWSSGNATLNGVTVSQCQGGGIHNEGTMAIANGLISNNSCPTDGGGIFTANSLQATGCQVVGNSTANGAGGGVCNAGLVSFSQTTIANNTAYSGFGGGIYDRGQQLTLVDCLVANNVALGQSGNGGGGGSAGVGGGLYSLSSAVIATNVTFSGNQAVGGARGAGFGGAGGGPNPGTGGTTGSAAGACGPAAGSGGLGTAGGKFSGGGGGGNGGAGHGVVLVSGCYRVCHQGPSQPYPISWYCGVHGSVNNRLGYNGSPQQGGCCNGCSIYQGPSITTCPSYATCDAEPGGSPGTGGNGGYGGGGGAPSGAGGAFAGSTGGGGAGMGSAAYVSAGSLALVNCTVANNQANGGSSGGHGVAAVFNELGQVVLLNTLIAGNWSTTTDWPDVYGTFSSQGHNFVGNTTNSSGWDPVWDYQNAVPLSIGALQDNGGPGSTHALLPGSLCILAGTSAGAPTTDQRGVIRPLNKCDIGAYQYTTLIQTVVTWTNPAPIVYTTPLSEVQLNANANVGGTFNYSPSVGTVLNAGSNQVITAIFTPSDPTSYTGATNTVLITVLKTNQTINFQTIPPQAINAPPITLGATASSGLPVAYALISGDALLAGNLLSVGSTPGQVVVRAAQAGNNNYTAATNVDQAFLVVSGSAPSITAQPTNQIVNLGGDARFSVAATTSPLSYQWQMQSLDLPGETNQSLVLLRVKTNQGGPYRVIVSNPIGSVTSVVAVLTVNAPAGVPAIVTQPLSQTARVGETVAFSVGATGNATLLYQWYQGASPNTNGLVVGATGSTYTSPVLTTNTSYWVSVRNTLGLVDSATATVTVLPAQSPKLSLGLLAGYPVITLDGKVGTNYVLQYKNSLSDANWTQLLNFNLNANPFQYFDTTATGQTRRYYRAYAY